MLKRASVYATTLVYIRTRVTISADASTMQAGHYFSHYRLRGFLHSLNHFLVSFESFVPPSKSSLGEHKFLCSGSYFQWPVGHGTDKLVSKVNNPIINE